MAGTVIKSPAHRQRKSIQLMLRNNFFNLTQGPPYAFITSAVKYPKIVVPENARFQKMTRMKLHAGSSPA